MKAMLLAVIFTVTITSVPHAHAAYAEKFDAAMAFLWLFSLGEAGGNDAFDPEKMRERGYFLGVFLGTSETGVESAGNSTVDPNSGQLTYSFIMEGNTNDKIAMQMELTKIGVYDVDVGSSSSATAVSVLALNAIAKLPITDSLNLFGKAGGGYSQTFVEDGALGGGVGSFAPDFGVGFQYNKNKHLGFRFSWSRYYYTADVVQGVGLPAINQRTSAEISGITLIYR